MWRSNRDPRGHPPPDAYAKWRMVPFPVFAYVCGKLIL